MDLYDRLVAHQRDQMARAPRPDLGAVMDRGDTLKTRRRILTMAMPVAAIAVVVVGVAVMRPSAEAAGNDDLAQVAAADAVLSLGNATFDWEVGPAALSWATSTATSDGVAYVLSTAPGTRWEDFPNGNVPEAIYVSTDGANWNSRPTGGTWVSSIAAADGLLYAVGTAPGASAETMTLQVGMSADQGASFELTQLPLGGSGPAHVQANVVAGDAGVLALASHTLMLDPWVLLPPEALEGDANAFTVDDGIAVFGSADLATVEQACYGGGDCQAAIDDHATYFATWEELGIDAAAANSGGITTRTAYLSSDGKNFEEVDYPLPEGWIDRSFNLDGTTVVSVSGNMSQMLASEDLVTWQPIDVDVGAGWISDIGKVGDEYVVAGQTQMGGPVVYRSDDLFGDWVEVPFADLVPALDLGSGNTWMTTAAVGPSGVVLGFSGEGGASSNPIMDLIGRVIPVQQDEAAQPFSLVFVTTDLQTWSPVTHGDIGAGSGWVESASFGPDGSLTLIGWGDATQPGRWQATTHP